MTRSAPPRKPQAFSVDDAEPHSESKAGGGKPKLAKARKPRAINESAGLRIIPDDAAQRSGKPETSPEALAESLTPPPPLENKKLFRWSRVFWLALTGLASLGVGLWVDELIRGLFDRQDWLGWLAVGFTLLLVVAAVAIAARELLGLRRMAKIDGLRDRATRAHSDDSIEQARGVVAEICTIYKDRPDTAHGRTVLASYDGEIIDGRNLLSLTERDLLAPLDLKSRALVMGSAKRVSVVTAISPRAIVDLAFVLMENMRLIRRVADLYGGRPGTLGFWQLARKVVAHLAVTGSIAVGDGLIQQLVGHGVAAKVSSRLGEGVVNGLLTARIGIAAIDVCRPLPFTAETRPSVKDFMGELLSSAPPSENGK